VDTGLVEGRAFDEGAKYLGIPDVCGAFSLEAKFGTKGIKDMPSPGSEH